MALDVVTDVLTPSARVVPAASAVSDANIERVAVEGPPVSATSDEPVGFREKVKAERAAFEAKPRSVATPVSAEVKPKAAAAPVQEPAAAETEPSEPVVAFPPLIPPPVLLDLGEKPTQGSNENWQDFNERQTRYAARITANEQRIAEANAAVERRNAEVNRIQERELQRVALTWQERKAQAIEQHPDFEAVTTADSVAISETMANQIVSIPNGPDVAYHLGKHPEEARRIHDLPIPRQIDAVARLSERLKAPAATKAAASTSRTAPAPKSAAPAPARVSAPDLERMSMSDYATFRNDQLLEERYGRARAYAARTRG